MEAKYQIIQSIIENYWKYLRNSLKIYYYIPRQVLIIIAHFPLLLYIFETENGDEHSTFIKKSNLLSYFVSLGIILEIRFFQMTTLLHFEHNLFLLDSSSFSKGREDSFYYIL